MLVGFQPGLFIRRVTAPTVSVVSDISTVNASIVRILDVLEIGDCGLVLGNGRLVATQIVSEAGFSL